MQKKNTKASILIWAIFMSLIISITFIQISTKINKNLQNNSDNINSLVVQNSIKNIINSGSIDGIFTDQFLINGDHIIFTKSNLIETSLKQSDEYLAKILLNNNNIDITVINGGPISYINNTNSGIISNTSSFTGSIGNLLINNLGGFTSIKISSEQEHVLLPKHTYYKIIKQIGNKQITKSKGKIKNF